MIDIIIDEGIEADLPESADIQTAVETACLAAHKLKKPTVCIRFAHDHTVQALNAQWRDKDKVTDVLSFPMQEAPYQQEESLGDIILAFPFVAHEAQRLGLDTQAHTLHLIVHGALHLLGFDHIHDNEAHTMQALENDVMHTLKLHQPYPDELSDCV